MKHIKSYSFFLENFEVDIMDSPDIKMSKEKMNTTIKHVKEYQQKKSLIDQLYSSTKDIKLIDSGLIKILGPTDIKNGIDRNPFLVDYTSVVKLKKSIEDISNDNITNKLKLDDFQRDLSSSDNLEMKKSISDKISELNKRMQDNVKKISDIKNELVVSEKEHKEKMISIDNDIKEFNKKISNVS